MDRRVYELSPDQESFLRRAIEHPPIAIPGKARESAQAAADAAWARIAEELGFDLSTIQMVDPDDLRHFSAIPRA